MDRFDYERRHGKFISKSPEKVWNYTTKAGLYRADWKAKLLMKGINLEKNSFSLEIGCGHGEYTQRLAKFVPRLVAVDISTELVEIAKRRVKAGNVRISEANAEALPFSDGKFQLVTGNSILHHLNLNAALKELSRVLARGGYLRFCEPNMLNPYLFVQKHSRLIKKLTGDSPTETAYYRWQMTDALKKAGFTDISVEPIDFMPPFLPDILFEPLKPVFRFLEGLPLVKEFSGVLYIKARKR